MSDTLFPLEDFEAEPRSALKEFISSKYLLLNALGLEVNKFDQKTPYVRLEFLTDARFYEPAYESGFSLRTQWTERNQALENNLMHWREASTPTMPEEGFVLCAASPYPQGVPGEPLLHVAANITDIDASSFAVPLSDIKKLSIYPDNTAAVKAMQQNAWADGGTYFINDMHNYSTSFSVEEVDAFVDMYWPEPTLIFEK